MPRFARHFCVCAALQSPLPMGTIREQSGTPFPTKYCENAISFFLQFAIFYDIMKPRKAVIL